jgi:hypothetical protein
MELLLNLVWLLLALPAYRLWRRSSNGGPVLATSSLQSFLVLGCTLVLLFPVISATDDLHAMRAEMEESSTSKRALRQAGSDRSSAWVNRLQSPPATVVTAMWMLPPEAEWLEVCVASLSTSRAPRAARSGRAPPCFLLG